MLELSTPNQVHMIITLVLLTVPAVSKISNIHCALSTSTCCIYKYRSSEAVIAKNVPWCFFVFLNLLPFGKNLRLWGHTSQQICLEQTVQSVREYK